LELRPCNDGELYRAFYKGKVKKHDLQFNCFQNKQNGELAS